MRAAASEKSLPDLHPQKCGVPPTIPITNVCNTHFSINESLKISFFVRTFLYSVFRKKTIKTFYYIKKKF